MQKTFNVATTPLRKAVACSITRFLVLIQGESGSGKSGLLYTILLRMAEALGALVQCAIIDGKTLTFMHMTRRFYVYTEPDEWLRVFRAFVNEMKRRYMYMSEACIDQLPVTEQTPYLVLVIDEANTVFTQTTWPTKAQRDEAMKLVEQYAAMCRGANMGLVVSCQSALSDCITTNTRSNLLTRFALRTSGPEQATAINHGDNEVCNPMILDVGMPGDMFAFTSETGNSWVRCRADYMSRQEQGYLLNKLNADKRPVAALAFDDPNYVG